jgi:hypothetical protein
VRARWFSSPRFVLRRFPPFLCVFTHILSEFLPISSKRLSKLRVAACVRESAERGIGGVCRHQLFLCSHIPRTRSGWADAKTRSGAQKAHESSSRKKTTHEIPTHKKECNSHEHEGKQPPFCQDANLSAPTLLLCQYIQMSCNVLHPLYYGGRCKCASRLSALLVTFAIVQVGQDGSIMIFSHAPVGHKHDAYMFCD